jgi:hypothetical protein
VLLDVQADGIFIQHLLDLLLTTKVEEWAGFGPLQSFGLQTPAFSLRWSDASRSYELNIGDRVTGSAGARFAYLPGYPDQVFKVDGSGVRMLEMISSFEVLRQKRLVSYTADDIDEFEIFKREGSPFYAQRQSGGWANRKQIKLPEAVRDWVEMLTHVRIQKFEDTPALARSLAEVIAKSPDLQITLKDRDAIPLKLQFKEINGREWAISSDRQGALFELFPGIIQRLRQTKF